MIQPIDITRELNTLPVSPEIRRQIEELWPDVEARLAEEASRQAKDAGTVNTGFLLAALAGVLIGSPTESDTRRPEALARLTEQAVTQATPTPRPEHRPRRPYDPVAFIALLDSFDEGDPDEQKKTLEHLKVALDRNRPGQRSIFGEGVNPMPPMDEIL